MKNRKMSTICVVMLIAALLAGCGGGAGAQPTGQEQAGQAQAGQAQAGQARAGQEQTGQAQAGQTPEETAEEGETAEEAEAAEDAVSDAEIAAKAAGGFPWIDSQAAENITEGMELSPKEDFHLYVNYDFMMRRKNGEESSSQQDVLLQEIKELLEADSAGSHEEELVQQYYRAYTDWDARNAAGLEPLRAVVEDIEGIRSLGEFSEFLCDPARSGNVPTLMRFMKYQSELDPAVYMAAAYFRGWGELLIDDPQEYEEPGEDTQLILAAVREEIIHDLTALGWSGEEAGDVFDGYFATEAVLATKLESLMDMMLSDGSEEKVTPIARIQEWMKDFPIEGLAKARGYTVSEFVQDNEDYMKLIGDFYTEENLEKIKDYHIVSFLMRYDVYCDEETFLIADKTGCADSPGSYERESDLDKVFGDLEYNFSEPLMKAYVERYDLSEEKKEMLDFFEEVRTVYREMLAEADWLSEETRGKAIEKLDDMKLFALYPDHFHDYSGLSFDGKSIAEIEMAIDRFMEQENASQAGSAILPDVYAFEQMPTLEDNAKSAPLLNGFMFSIGILKSSGYSADMSLEDMYGIIGYVLAHEMSHCFDENGSQIDKYGRMVNWWTEEDRAAFEARLQKLVDYFDGITVFEGVNCNGEYISAEATADITSLQAIMKLARTKEGFDYDRFFRAYASAHAYYSSYKKDLAMLSSDTHPLDYLRTNVVVQQFDEFMETYDVKEGDGMYLAPEDRILVW